MIGTDLSFLDYGSLFVSDIDGQMLIVLVDSKIQYEGNSVRLKVCKRYFTLRGICRVFFML